MVHPRLTNMPSLPAVIALCETRLKADDVPTVKGYSWVSSSKPGYPGCGFFVHNSIPHRLHGQDTVSTLLRPSGTDLSIIDICWLQARLPNTQRDMLIACVYINTNSRDFDNNRHWTILEQCLESGLDTDRDMLVVGDLNAEHVELGGRRNTVAGRRLAAVVNNLDLVCLNRLHCPEVVTRPSPLLVLENGGSTIDLAFSNSSSLVTTMAVDRHADTSDCITGLHSDHLPLIIHLDSCCKTGSDSQQFTLQPSKPRWKCREATDTDWQSYTNLLESCLQQLEPSLVAQLAQHHSPLDTVESVWASLRDIIVEVGEITIGRYRNVGGAVRNIDPYWKQPGVAEAAAALKAAHRRYKHYPNDSKVKQQFCEARSEWRRTKAQAKQNWWSETCAAVCRDKKDPAAMWRAFKNTKPAGFVPLTNVMSDTSAGTGASLPNSVCSGIETTAKYFANICSENKVAHSGRRKAQLVASSHLRIQSDIQVKAQQISRQVSTQPMSDDETISAADVKQVCRWFTNPVKAVGPDQVHPKLLSLGGPTLYVLLAAIMNYSLSFGVVPTEWKQANVTALYKGKDLSKSDPGSFRPVSVTCAVARVMERILFNRIAPQLDSQLSSSQSGFRKGRSCYDNLLRITNAIQTARAKGSHLPAIFLDLNKAFDTVWHPGLLSKLWQKGVTGRTWLWIRSFLFSRQIRVVQSGYASSWFNITAGVPQGSVLAPLLFLVYINDLAESLLKEQVEVALLADDVALWPTITAGTHWAHRYEALQRALKRCETWADKWKMKWSTTKSNVVTFGRKAKGIKLYQQSLKLSGSTMQPADSYTYLGLTLHKTGSWKSHFDKLLHRVTVAANQITRVNQRHGTPTPIVIRQLVMAIPRTTILWALPFWKPTESQFNRLNSILVKPLRVSLCLPTCTNRAAVLAEFGMADVQATRQQQILQYVARLRQSAIDDNPARDLITDHEFNPDDPDSALLPFWDELHEIERTWNVSTQNATQSAHFKRLMVARHFEQYRASPPTTNPPRPGLRTVKLQPGVSRYLYHDTKNSAVLRARLRFDLNGLQLGVVATRVATSKRTAMDRTGANETEVSDHDTGTLLLSRCKLCGLDESDSRRHLLTQCLALDSQRCDCQFDMQSQVWNQRRSNPYRIGAQSANCAVTRSVELFMLGELNCPRSSTEHTSVTTEITSMQPHVQSQFDVRENPRSTLRSVRLAVRERILATSCACMYPSLPVDKRLTSTALFIRHIFRARFPGTATDVTISSVAAAGQSQSNPTVRTT